jgi:tartrate-resistant acid phosphatase type 5
MNKKYISSILFVLVVAVSYFFFAVPKEAGTSPIAVDRQPANQVSSSPSDSDYIDFYSTTSTTQSRNNYFKIYINQKNKNLTLNSREKKWLEVQVSKDLKFDNRLDLSVVSGSCPFQNKMINNKFTLLNIRSGLQLFEPTGADIDLMFGCVFDIWGRASYKISGQTRWIEASIKNIIFDNYLWNFKDKKKLTVLVFGDWGKGTTSQRLVGEAMTKACKNLSCDFAVTTGDNIYEFGVSSVSDSLWRSRFENMYPDLRLLVFPTLGNHDHYGNPQAQIDYSKIQRRWKLPDYYYELAQLPSWLQIVGLDTEKWDQDQYQFAENKFCNNSAKSWKFAIGHHPVFSAGNHGDSWMIMDDLLSLFNKCQVDLYLAGHDHHQEHLEMANIDFVVQGAAAETRSVNRNISRSDPVKSKFASTKIGFSILEVTQRFYKVSYFDVQSKLLYSFTRSK